MLRASSRERQTLQTLGLSDHGAPRPVNPAFRLSPGAVLTKAASIWVACLLPFWVVTLVVQSPLILAQYWMIEEEVGPDTFTWVSAGVNVLLLLVLLGALTYGVFQRLRGRRPSIAAILRVGLVRIAPVFLVALLLGMALAAAGLASAFFFGFLFGVFGLAPVAMVLVVAVVVVVLTGFWVAVPTAVVENPGAFASLRRSQELTEDSRIRIFALLLVLWVVNYAVGRLVPLLVQAAGVDLATIAGGIANWAAGAPFQSLGAASAAVAYHELRTGKEGVDVEELIKVFE
jgi:hypothetical protein